MTTLPQIIRRHIAASTLLALIVSSASAQSVWNTTTGNWSTAGNWSPSGVPVSGTTTTLEFINSGTTYTTTDDIAGNFTLNTLKLSGSSSDTLTIARSASQAFVFDGTNAQIQYNYSGATTVLINPSIVLNVDTTVTSTIGNASGTLYLFAISGSGALIIDYTSSATGTVILNGANTGTGGVQLLSGRLALTRNTVFGTGDVTLSGGLLRMTSGVSTTLNFANTLNITGNVQIFDNSGSGAFAFTNGGTIGGTNATHTLTIGAAKTLTLGGAFSGTGNGLTFAGTTSGAVVNLGSGTSDTSANTYSGTTTLSGSGVTLNLNKANGTNVIAGNLTVSAGTLTWSNSNQISDTSALTLAGGTVAIGTFSDTVGTLGLTGNASITLGSGGTLAFANSSSQSWSTFSLSISGNFINDSSIRFGTDSSGLTADQLSAISINGLAASIDANGFLYTSAIPEPSTFALLVGLTAFAITVRRRRA